jgi:hypothetical protein
MVRLGVHHFSMKFFDPARPCFGMAAQDFFWPAPHRNQPMGRGVWAMQDGRAARYLARQWPDIWDGVGAIVRGGRRGKAHIFAIFSKGKMD